MNPQCAKDLIINGNNIGDMAHIKPVAEGGGDEPENLILLCKNCHKEIDSSRNGNQIENQLRAWKSNQRKMIKQHYEKEVETFFELEEIVAPIFRENERIFSSYGPRKNDSRAHHLWLSSEPVLVANNERICSLLTKNMRLFHEHNQEIIQEFIGHADEFKSTREDTVKIRINLFPEEILSIFGIKQCKNGFEDSVSPLQNLIKKLKEEKRFVSLEIEPPILRYKENGKACELRMSDIPRVKQMYFSYYSYKGKRTDLTIKSLRFFLKWLSDHKIPFEIEDYSDLTRLKITSKKGDEYQIKLYYSYCLSESDIQSSEIRSGWLLVNVYNWNGGRFYVSAYDYAKDIGASLFNQNSFFVFCHKEII